MKIVQPSAELVWITPDAVNVIARIGRESYQSEPHGLSTSADFVLARMHDGHLGVLEHASASLRFVTDRGITHELVRHRLVSFLQESTRFCAYDRSRFGGEITVVQPSGLDFRGLVCWWGSCAIAESNYLAIRAGHKAEVARSVLPTCTKAVIVATCNFREWLWVLRQRSSANPHAHPDMVALMDMAQLVLEGACPEVFSKDAEAVVLRGEIERAQKRLDAIMEGNDDR